MKAIGSPIGVQKPSIWSRVKAEWNRSKTSYLFIAPFLILFTVFTVVPVVLSIVLSFTYFNTLQPPQWVGLDNYIRLFLDDDVFQIAVKNTFILRQLQVH